MSPRVSAQNIDLTLFYLGLPAKKSKSVRPPPLLPLWANPLKILENLTPPNPPSWIVLSSKKGKAHFLKKQDYFCLVARTDLIGIFNAIRKSVSLKIYKMERDLYE